MAKLELACKNVIERERGAATLFPCKYREDWGLDDPTGKSDEEFIKTAKTIEEKIKDLANRIENNEINLD